MTTISSTSIFDPKALSPVQQLLQQEKATASSTDASGSSSSSGKSTSYQDQDWYIRAKVAQLKDQINTYSNLPGLDPSGSIINSLTKEVNKLVKQQQDKLKAAQADAAAKKAELDKQQKQAKLDALHPSVEQMLQRAKAGADGETIAAYQPPDTSKGAGDGKVISADAMLANVRGGTVDTSA